MTARASVSSEGERAPRGGPEISSPRRRGHRLGYHDIYDGLWRWVIQRMPWKASEPRTAIEIGVYEGESTFWTLDHLLRAPESRLVSIDPWDGADERHDRFMQRLQARPDAAKVTVLREFSRPALTRLAHEGLRADFAYIDGSHAAPDVLTDLVLVFGMMKVGGLVICDDYLWADPKHGGEHPLGRPKIAIDAFTNIYAEKIAWAPGVPNVQAIFTKTAD